MEITIEAKFCPEGHLLVTLSAGGREGRALIPAHEVRRLVEAGGADAVIAAVEALAELFARAVQAHLDEVAAVEAEYGPTIGDA